MTQQYVRIDDVIPQGHPFLIENTDLLYDSIIKEARDLMIKKNHDYGDSWRLMRSSSITDQILVKVARIIELEKNGSSKTPDSIEVELFDILNYCVFGIIKIKENNELNKLMNKQL